MSYEPSGETEVQLLGERTSLDGAIVSGVVYGIHFTLFAMCADLLVRQRDNKRGSRLLLLYITVLFILGTIYMISAARIAQLTFIDYRNFPGGPAAFQIVDFSIPINFVGSVAYEVANWVADGILLWRFILFWRESRTSWLIVFPSLIYLGSIIMGIFVLIQVSRPQQSLWSSINFTLPYFILSLSLNIIVTSLIIAKLLIQKKRIAAVLGAQHGAQYTSVVAIIVESAALSCAGALVLLILYLLNNPVQFVFLQVQAQVQIIAPLLIIFRVARGRAWSSETNAIVSTGVHITKPASSNVASGTALGSGYSEMSKQSVVLPLHQEMPSADDISGKQM